MDAFAVELDRRAAPSARRSRSSATASSLEAHARVADTITYELASGIDSGPARASRLVVDG